MSDIIKFVVEHEAALASLGVAVLDLLFAVSPSLEGNGILHQVYLWIKAIVSKPQPPAAT